MKLSNIFGWIKDLLIPKPAFFPGVIDDPEEIKDLHDFHEIVAASAAPVWSEKAPLAWRKFPEQFQWNSSSCVWFTMAKIALILFFLETKRVMKFSAGYYRRRANYPTPGTAFEDVKYKASLGIPTEQILPSENLTENQMNTIVIPEYVEDSADAFAVSPDWVRLPLDFDVVAATLNKTNKGIMVWFDFGKGEFFDQGEPVHKNVKQIYRHSVCAIDQFTYKGRQYILIEDSAEVDTKYGHQKLITRDFFDRHALLAAYPMNFKFNADKKEKPIYDGGVVSLQNCLKYEGVFPSNIESTGYLGSVTRESVMKFQERYGLDQTGNVGPKTTAKLKELYS